MRGVKHLMTIDPKLYQAQSINEVLALINGEDLDSFRKKEKVRNRIHEEAQKYIGKPSDEWPTINFNWDLTIEGQKFSLDGCSQEKFDKHYPSGFLLGHVNLIEFDSKLCKFSRRDNGELWNVGNKQKLAYLIVYLSEENSISPPYAKPLDSGEFVFCGGHHRYAIAKELKESEIPIYIEPKYKTQAETLVNISWVCA